MRVIIGADTVPTIKNRDYFINGDLESLIGIELIKILEDADYRICNLEVPLVDVSAPIKKSGPALIASTETIKGYRKLNIDLVTLANNHIMDQGIKGLESTISTLDSIGIKHIGVGKNIKDIEHSTILVKGNNRIGVYSCAEHEYSIADDYKPGANPFDPSTSLKEIEKLKKKVDYLIVLYHGGKEQYRYPSPELQKVCRLIIDFGADLVICQHTHCIGCEEIYKNGLIIYGQGNFIFDLNSNEYWNSGMLVKIDENFTISYIPFVKNDGTIRLARPDMAEKILADYKKRSELIKKEDFIQEEYKKFSKSKLLEYLERVQGHKSFFYKIGKRLFGNRFTNWYMNQKYNEKEILSLLNVIECEPHREMIISGLKQKI